MPVCNTDRVARGTGGGGQVVATGPEALAQMRTIVLTGQAVEAFETGRMEPLQIK